MPNMHYNYIMQIRSTILYMENNDVKEIIQCNVIKLNIIEKIKNKDKIVSQILGVFLSLSKVKGQMIFV